MQAQDNDLHSQPLLCRVLLQLIGLKLTLPGSPQFRMHTGELAADTIHQLPLTGSMGVVGEVLRLL
jgi:hypothetical protein